MVSYLSQGGSLLRPAGKHAAHEVLKLRADPFFLGAGPGLFSIFMTFKYIFKDNFTDQGPDAPH